MPGARSSPAGRGQAGSTDGAAAPVGWGQGAVKGPCLPSRGPAVPRAPPPTHHSPERQAESPLPPRGGTPGAETPSDSEGPGLETPRQGKQLSRPSRPGAGGEQGPRARRARLGVGRRGCTCVSCSREVEAG